MKVFKKERDLKTYELKSYLEGHIFALGRIGCLEEKTEIYIFNNKLIKMKLKDLPSNFKVVSYNFIKNKKEIKEAVKIDSGKKICYEIELENGKKVIASSEHVFYSKNGEIKVSDMKVGDELLISGGISGCLGTSKKEGNYNRKMGWQKGHACWCKGKTKQTLPQLSKKDNKNYKGWNKGLTMQNDIRVKKYSDKLRDKPHPWQIGELNVSKREDVKQKISKATSGEKNGMFGKKHTQEFKDMMSRITLSNNPMKRKEVIEKHAKAAILNGIKFKKEGTFAGQNNPMYGKLPKFKKPYKDEKLGHCIRSSWEKEVCNKLVSANITYEYEVDTFKLSIGKTYTPDLKLINSYIEIKGPIFDKQIEKMKIWKMEHNKKLIVITSRRFFNKFPFADILIDYYDFLKEENEILKNKIN